MVAVHELSWEEVSAPDFGARAAWRAAVAEIAAKAKETLPACNGRVDSAVKIVLAGDVELQVDGTARVASQSNGTTVYHIVNGECTCKDFPKAPSGWCKHRIAAGLAKRVAARVRAQLDAGTNGKGSRMVEEPVKAADMTYEASGSDKATTGLPGASQAIPDVPVPAQAEAPAETAQGVPAQYVVLIQGRPFVKFAGLLKMAHEHGLVALTADWIYNDAELSLAHAVATFQDGRRFEESGDASPANVTRMVAVHFRRVALTRAKARVLRDALGIDLVAVEELADE